MIDYKLYRKIRDLAESYYISPPTPEWLETEVACPDCGAELLINTRYTMMSCPPLKDGKCSKCEWIGYM